MCGIAGKINFHSRPSLSAVEKMTGTLTHRGPDFGKVLPLDEYAIMGHRRLSIIDLSEHANQPMQDSSKRYFIVYNGEVYNFVELRRELEKDGCAFQSASDTEVVLYSYVKWGTDCFARLNGMFALAIWDTQEKTCVLARDRLGEKPLYYTVLNNELTFASECTALLEDGQIKSRLSVSTEALNHYFALGYILAPCSIYNEINKLEPATYLTYSRGDIVNKCIYWDYKKYFFTKIEKTEREIAEHLNYLIDKSIRYRLVSDVPVGAFLSGGLDSSGIAAIAQKHCSGDLKTFSAIFEAESYNEGNDARFVADYLHTKHHEVSMDIKTEPFFIDHAIQCYDEPFSDTSLIPMVAVSRFASQKVKVALSGDGSDELFGGYITYKADKIKKWLDVFPFFARKLSADFLDTCAIESSRKMNFGFKIRQFSKGLPGDFRYAHYAWRELFTLKERIALIGRHKEEEIYQTDPFRRFKRYYDEVSDFDNLSQHQYVDVKTWLADDILVKVDRAAMACSLETRCPYLDAEIVEYAAAIPSYFKQRKFTGKYILKKQFENILPSKIINKKKSGFNAPVNVWLGRSRENEFKTFNRYVYAKKELINHE